MDRQGQLIIYTLKGTVETVRHQFALELADVVNKVINDNYFGVTTTILAGCGRLFRA